MADDRWSDAVLQPLRDTSSFESTVEQLAAAIRLGVFRCGEHLPAERELSVRLGVSRLNLREAIAALREADMVKTRRGRSGGTVVTYTGTDHHPESYLADLRRRGPQLTDALDFRRVVEPGAAHLAATRALSADQRAWLVASEGEVRAAKPRALYRMADSRLHLAIATVSGSPMLIEAVMRTQSVLHDLLATMPFLPRDVQHSHDQHRAVVAAILGGDSAGARDVMAEHCEVTSALAQGLLR